MQEAYITGRHHHFPINEAFLRFYAEDLSMLMMPNVKYYDDFVTEDGTHWRCVRVLLTDVVCRILFPKERDRTHEDGTVSACHVAFYFDANRVLSEEEVDKFGRTLFSVFDMARREFRQQK